MTNINKLNAEKESIDLEIQNFHQKYGRSFWSFETFFTNWSKADIKQYKKICKRYIACNQEIIDTL